MHIPFSHAASLVLISAAKPMLSLGITRFNILSEPSLLAIASWLNSIRCSFTNENLENNAQKIYYWQHNKCTKNLFVPRTITQCHTLIFLTICNPIVSNETVQKLLRNCLYTVYKFSDCSFKWRRWISNLLGRSKEDGAAIDIFSLRFGHSLCTGFWWEDAIVTILLQFRQKEVVKLVCLYLLK